MEYIIQIMENRLHFLKRYEGFGVPEEREQCERVIKQLKEIMS